MPRRVPVPSLRPALDLCKPTGVALGRGDRVVVAADEGGVASLSGTLLEKRGVTVLPLDGATPTPEVTSRLDGWLKDGPMQGVFWLPALDVEPAMAEMDLAAFREANRRRVKNLHATMQVLYDSVAAPGTFLVSRDAHGRPPRPDAGGRDRAPRRGGGRLHEVLQARARPRPSSRSWTSRPTRPRPRWPRRSWPRP